MQVSGDGTYGPVSFTPDAIGTYHWKATYTPAAGDPNNLTSDFNGDCSGTPIYTQTVQVNGASPQTVHTTNTTVSTTAANVSWRLTYTSNNPAQRSIGQPASRRAR